jgi:predicted DNA-binding protein
MKSATRRNFHLPLPPDTYENLKAEARKRGRPATVLARHAIESWLRRARASELYEEIASYARSHKSWDADLDASLESAGIESLLESDEA